jgi:nucleoside-diphosphate-sugar epimerase
MSSKGLVLVTGANGFIAARTVEAFLNAGYSVRGTVRSKSSAAGLLAALPEAVSSGKFELVEVPDITASGAFDEAVKGVIAIAHLASPVSFFFTDPDYVIGTAVNGVKSVLESAIKEPGVKSFVLMSSVVAISGGKPLEYVFTEADWNDQAPAILAELGNKAPGPVIYSVSKIEGEKEFWKFQQEKKPTFTMTTVNPA